MANLKIQNEGEYICFAVFENDVVDNVKKLKYSKYNFNFTKYRNDFPAFATLSDNKTFYDFIVKNETDLAAPFTVKDSLKQYFTAITDDIRTYFDNYNYILWDFNFNTLPTFANSQTIMDNEFNLYAYDYFTEIASLCEFLHESSKGIFCKYNFNFALYSSDFNVYGSKICIFYDFYIRASYLSENLVGFLGFHNFPTSFDKYFDLTQEGQTTLKTYLINHSIFSSFENDKKSITILLNFIYIIVTLSLSQSYYFFNQNP